MEPRTRVRVRAAAVAGLFLLIGLWICVEALQVPFGSLRMPGAGFMPLVLGVTLSALALVLFFSEWLVGDTAAARLGPDGSEVLWVTGILIVAVWLFDRAGFVLAMVLFLTVSMGVLRRGRWLTAVVTAVIGSVTSYWVFGRLLQISLPAGPLGF